MHNPQAVEVPGRSNSFNSLNYPVAVLPSSPFAFPAFSEFLTSLFGMQMHWKDVFCFQTPNVLHPASSCAAAAGKAIKRSGNWGKKNHSKGERRAEILLDFSWDAGFVPALAESGSGHDGDQISRVFPLGKLRQGQSGFATSQFTPSQATPALEHLQGLSSVLQSVV